MRRPHARPVAALLLVLAVVLPGCGGGEPTAPSPSGAASAALRFASFNFSESQILVEVYAEAARRAGVPVHVEHDIGTREIVSPALAQGLVDVVIDYLGTSLAFSRPDAEPAKRTPEELHAALVRSLWPHGVTVLRAARAEDQNGFAVTDAFSEKHDLTRMSDLAPLAPGLRFGGPPECPDRPFCLLGLRQVYGLQFGEVLAMPSRAATAEALVSGQIDVGMLETTDARLAVSPLVLLADDLGLQPHENVVPLVRADALDRWGDRLRTALEDVSDRLTTRDLVLLNRAVELGGRTPAEAAARWWDGG